jgi:hypothetical protein
MKHKLTPEEKQFFLKYAKAIADLEQQKMQLQAAASGAINLILAVQKLPEGNWKLSEDLEFLIKDE